MKRPFSISQAAQNPINALFHAMSAFVHFASKMRSCGQIVFLEPFHGHQLGLVTVVLDGEKFVISFARFLKMIRSCKDHQIRAYLTRNDNRLPETTTVKRGIRQIREVVATNINRTTDIDTKLMLGLVQAACDAAILIEYVDPNLPFAARLPRWLQIVAIKENEALNTITERYYRLNTLDSGPPLPPDHPILLRISQNEVLLRACNKYLACARQQRRLEGRNSRLYQAMTAAARAI